MAFSTLGLALGVGLVALLVLMHYSKGSGWEPTRDIADEIMERRAATVPDTEFPEPMNRSIGGGGAAGAIPAGEEAELEEGEAAEEEEGPWSLSDEEAETYEIEYVKEGATIEVQENETLLDAGEEEGWDLPYACREGQCLSCSAHVDGDSRDVVVHHDQEMLNDEELSEGYMLTCVAHPQSDFALETSESP